MSTDAADARPAYQRVADELRQAIASGKYAPGDQLPTLAELAEQHGIAVMTVRESIKLLVAEGLVVSRQGKGVFVLRTPTAEESPASGAEVLTMLHQLEKTVERLADRLTAVEAQLDGSQPRQAE
jgi:DNA-binding GntR family transcriptional regulator